ncbi:hypothetical protein BT69DRAFT_267279 [Atractiella rhizophila]|nr:hypothetical protein BT69DRAFT_267279 [Atractiella rhizophila]
MFLSSETNARSSWRSDRESRGWSSHSGSGIEPSRRGVICFLSPTLALSFHSLSNMPTPASAVPRLWDAWWRRRWTVAQMGSEGVQSKVPAVRPSRSCRRLSLPSPFSYALLLPIPPPIPA